MARGAPSSGAARPPFRVGLGGDRHPFDPKRPLVLGGVVIPGGPGLRGHSDADVLAHAVCDAILGALGLPDMGERFRSTDPRWRGAASRVFLEVACAEARRAGYAPGNVDTVLFAEIPRLAPHVPSIRASLARILGIPAGRLGVKVKSGEGLGWVGRREGIAAQAVVLLVAARRPGRRPSRRARP